MAAAMLYREGRSCAGSFGVVLRLAESKEFAMESALTAKGQTTIPKAIRDHLDLRAGDRVKFFVHPDGSVVILPKRPVSVLRGMVKPLDRPVSVEEMTEAAAAEASGIAARR
jgi:antitoxin PrlF